MENENVCNICDGIIAENENSFETHDGDIICEDCYNNNYFTCADCGEIFHTDYGFCLNGEIYCEECLDNISFVCADCGDRHHNDEMHELQNGDLICTRCRDNGSYYYCEDCGELFDYGVSGMYVDDGDYFVCEGCSENYVTCAECDNVVHVDNTVYDDDTGEYYCNECYNNYSKVNYAYSLKDYGFKPNLEIFSTGNEENKDLYIGFENETENNNSGVSKDEFCDTVGHAVNTDDKVFCYFKRDGSLNNGVEIVSHAFTLEYMQKNEEIFRKLLKTATDCGYKSHDTSTCGLHVHINKAYFGDTKEEQDENINKLLLFFECYKENIKAFSRRNNYHYCTFLSDFAYLSKDKERCCIENIKKYKGKQNRYGAINIQNSKTVEIRIFRGSLKFETFMASLEFVFNLARVVKENPLSKITWSKVINYKGSKYIKNYCKERNIENSKNGLKDYSLEILKERRKFERELHKTLKEVNKTITLLSRETWQLVLSTKKELEKSIIKENSSSVIHRLGNLMSFYNTIKLFENSKHHLNGLELDRIALDYKDKLDDVKYGFYSLRGLFVNGDENYETLAQFFKTLSEIYLKIKK